MNHTIVVACGSGIATSTHVATVLKEKLSERGFPVTTRQCRVQDLSSNVDGASLVVTTSAINTNLRIPVITGIAFLTGMGVDQKIDEIVDELTGSETSSWPK